VRTIVREVRALDVSVQSTISELTLGGSQPFDPEEHPGQAAKILTEYVCMRRNKRCLLAYHRVRTQKIDEMIWKGVDLLDANSNTAAQGQDKSGTRSTDLEGEGASRAGESALSPEEEEYARAYGDLLAAYKGQWTDIDLTGSLEPPRDLFVDVRVLKDAGEIQTEYGYVIRA
jgi:GINS complex subunit 1